MGGVPLAYALILTRKFSTVQQLVFFKKKKITLQGAPSRRQNQNGQVERAWEAATNMARAFITGMQMPKNFWYWALHQSIQVMSYILCTVSGISTTPHKLVYSVKPDLRILFCLFSTGYFRKAKDGMLYYSPHSKEIITSSDYKLDEGRHTPIAFNLPYDGGIFVSLYNHNSSSSFEPYPEGTSLSYSIKLNQSDKHTTNMRGTVISIPIPYPQSGLPASDKEASSYVIRLIDGSIHRVSPDLMEQFATTPSNTTNKIKFLSWLGNNQKVMYLMDGIYVKGVMEWSQDDNSWRLSHRHKNGTELFGILLPEFCKEFQKYIDDNTILPGWHSGKILHCWFHTPCIRSYPYIHYTPRLCPKGFSSL